MESTSTPAISTDNPQFTVVAGLGTSPTRPLGPRPTLPTQRLTARPLARQLADDAWPRTDHGGWRHVRTGRTDPIGSAA